MKFKSEYMKECRDVFFFYLFIVENTNSWLCEDFMEQ